MWAMGCVLYEMLTLRKVFDATVSKMSLKFHVHMVSDPSPLQGGGVVLNTDKYGSTHEPNPLPFCMPFWKGIPFGYVLVKMYPFQTLS